MKRRFALPGLALAVLLAGAGAAWVRSHRDASSPVLYTATLGGNPAALAVDGRTGRLFVTATRGAGSVLDAATGAVLGVIPIPGAALAVDERAGTVLVIGAGGVSMLDATRGRYLRTIPVGTAFNALVVNAHTGHAFVADPGSNTVVMLDTHSGAVLRLVSMIMTPTTLAVDRRADQILVGSASPFVAVLDARSGVMVRNLVFRASSGVMAVDGASGHAFLADTGGASVAVLDTRSGQALHIATVGRFPVAVAVDARRGRAYVASRDEATSFNPTTTGSVSVLDTRTGAVPRTIPVGVDPVAIAVDEGSGRVFVATRGGAATVPDAWGWLPGWLRARLPFLPPPGARLRVLPPGVTALAVPS